jgi:hypothetical protein
MFWVGAMLAAAVAPAEQATIFRAAGFAATGGRFLACDGRSPLEAQVGDFNGDKRPDALVIDQGLQCYGADETGFVLVSKGANGGWTKLYGSPGVPRFLTSRGGGWPELEVGGPGFCFPILRWNGRTFAEARRQYQGKPCRR